MPTILIVGAHSDIGLAIAHKYASLGNDLQLVCRKSDRLDSVKKDIELRYQTAVSVHEFDILNRDYHDSFIGGLNLLPEIAVCCVGKLGEHNENIRNSDIASDVLRTNFEGPAIFLGNLANHFEQRGYGTLVGISSVAGERGRGSNYVYGASKAGFTAFLSGLRNRLDCKGIRVVTVIPGFVNTRMTEGLKLPSLLTAQPDEVANVVFKNALKGKDVIYVRPIWSLIMLMIKLIPEAIFKKLSL